VPAGFRGDCDVGNAGLIEFHRNGDLAARTYLVDGFSSGCVVILGFDEGCQRDEIKMA